jgi:hypothetical protein
MHGRPIPGCLMPGCSIPPNPPLPIPGIIPACIPPCPPIPGNMPPRPLISGIPGIPPGPSCSSPIIPGRPGILSGGPNPGRRPRPHPPRPRIPLSKGFPRPYIMTLLVKYLSMFLISCFAVVFGVYACRVCSGVVLCCVVIKKASVRAKLYMRCRKWNVCTQLYVMQGHKSERNHSNRAVLMPSATLLHLLSDRRCVTLPYVGKDGAFASDCSDTGTIECYDVIGQSCTLCHQYSVIREVKVWRSCPQC